VEGYKEDLAYIHDVGFGSFSLNAAPGLLGILRQYGITQGFVIDLGCGSGLWARELTQVGYEVLGIDFSAAMIAIAREKAPKAHFQQGSFLQTPLPSCDAVTSLGECFNYLFDQSNNKQALIRLFRRVYAALRPGGVFIFDLVEPGYVRGPNPLRSYREGEDWATLVHVEEHRQRKTLTRHITLFRKVGKLYRRSEEVHRLRLYKGTEIAKVLRRVGFRVRLLRGYGEFRFRRAHVGFVARKP
jgi:SAM-dependent methyltransferase